MFIRRLAGKSSAALLLTALAQVVRLWPIP